MKTDRNSLQIFGNLTLTIVFGLNWFSRAGHQNFCCIVSLWRRKFGYFFFLISVSSLRKCSRLDLGFNHQGQGLIYKYSWSKNCFKFLFSLLRLRKLTICNFVSAVGDAHIGLTRTMSQSWQKDHYSLQALFRTRKQLIFTKSYGKCIRKLVLSLFVMVFQGCRDGAAI